MYKDFKKCETLDTGFVGGSGIIWMFSGIVLGLLVGLAMYFITNEKTPAISVVDSLQKQIEQVQATKPIPKAANQVLNVPDEKKTKQTREHKFSYYAVLPTLDVPIGSERPINTAPIAKTEDVKVSQEMTKPVAIKADEKLAEPQKVNASIEQEQRLGDYLLQVASFKKESMADKTRGRLSNKGIDAYIQKKKIKGRFWYRVVAGPVDQVSVDHWKSAAEELGHRPLVISVR